MIKLGKRTVSLLLILLAIIAVSLTIYMGNKAQAGSYQYCSDPCNPYCYT
jgi:hypothetical protein